jgi:hypothetical protein
VKRALVLVVVIVLALMWWGGSFDEPLSHVGLNRNPCVKNHYGATFCGDEAKSYCARHTRADPFGGSERPSGCDEVPR